MYVSIGSRNRTLAPHSIFGNGCQKLATLKGNKGHLGFLSLEASHLLVCVLSLKYMMATPIMLQKYNMMENEAKLHRCEWQFTIRHPYYSYGFMFVNVCIYVYTSYNACLRQALPLHYIQQRLTEHQFIQHRLTLCLQI